MSLTELNPWGMLPIASAIVSLLFAHFLWKTATPTPITRMFIVLLLVEIVTVLTSSSGLLLLFDYSHSKPMMMASDLLHHLGDFLMLMLYPIFVAHALPVRFLKPLATPSGKRTVYSIGFVAIVVFSLIHSEVIKLDINIDMFLYLMMVVMFIAIFFISLAGVRAAKTKLAREKALAFVCAFGLRDLAWAAVYLLAMLGFGERIPRLLDVLYVGSTLIYVPIMAYGILKLQMLDIEIRLKSTIKTSILAGAFGAFFYLISEVANAFLSEQLGDVIGFAASAVLTLFLSPLHRWADRFSTKLVSADIEEADYADSRSLQVYSAAVEETMAFGDVTKGHLALLDRLRDSLQVSQDDATRLERELDFSRTAIAG